MSDDAPKKKLMPELLPKPVSFPGTAARARVISHLRILAATGAATMTLAACPFIAVDPLPPPPKCRTTRGVAGDLMANVGPGSSLGSDGGMLPDGGQPLTFTLSLTETASFGGGGASVNLTSLILSTNTTRASLSTVPGGSGSGGFRVSFEPTDLSMPIELRFATTCEGSAAVVLKADLTPTGSGTYSVVLRDVP
ncbi:MAG: hypothetical protein QM817_27910 [Archangium sp.]